MTLDERWEKILKEYDTHNEPFQTIGALAMRAALLEETVEVLCKEIAAMKVKFHELLPYHKI